MAKKQVVNKQVANRRTQTKAINSKTSEAEEVYDEDASPLEILLEKGKKQKVVTQSDILEVLPDGDLSSDAADALIAQLVENGIEVLDDDDEDSDTESLADVDEPDDAALQEVEEELGDEDFLNNQILELASSELTNDPVRMYLREIGQVNLLTAADEISLAKRIQKGMNARKALDKNGQNGPADETAILKAELDGKLAKRCLAEANLRLVVSVAKRYIGRGMNFLDLIQEGNIGLLRAVEKFDHRRGYKFSTYATWWIRQAVSRALSDQGRTIRVPVHMGERITQLSRISRELVQRNGHEPTEEEIAAEMGITVRLLERIRQAAQYPLSLEMEVGEDMDSTLGDFIEDNRHLPPNDSATRKMLQERLNDVLASLTARECRVLQLRFGLQDGRAYTLEEVGQKFGVTRERIRQIEAKALSKLRHPRRSRRLRDFLE